MKIDSNFAIAKRVGDNFTYRGSNDVYYSTTQEALIYTSAQKAFMGLWTLEGTPAENVIVVEILMDIKPLNATFKPVDEIMVRDPQFQKK